MSFWGLHPLDPCATMESEMKIVQIDAIQRDITCEFYPWSYPLKQVFLGF